MDLAQRDFHNPRMSRGRTLLVLLAVAPLPAFAYIDPGTGSMLVQSLLAVVAGALVFGRTLWQRVKGLMRRRRKTDDPAER
jgi:hypothetical protein